VVNVLAKIFQNKNFLSLANNGLIAVFGFFGFLLLVRSLGTNQFGEWVLFITTANFIDMLRFGITRTAIVRFLAGAEHDEAKKLIGSNYLINLVSTLIIILIVLVINFFFSETVKNSGFILFFQWFPVLALINLPFNNAQSVLQARMQFDRILLLRSVNVGLFMLFLLLNYFAFRFPLSVIVYAMPFKKTPSFLNPGQVPEQSGRRLGNGNGNLETGPMRYATSFTRAVSSQSGNFTHLIHSDQILCGRSACSTFLNPNLSKNSGR